MSAIELPTKMEGSDRIVTVEYDFGDNLEEMRSILTGKGVKDVDAVIFSNARANMKVSCRAVVKTAMKKTDDKVLTDEQIQAKVNEWTPGVSVEREPVSREKKLNAFEKEFDKMSAEEKQGYLDALRTRLAGAGA